MIRKALRYLHHLRSLQRMNLSLNRATASGSLREIHPNLPSTWEFTGFSQHGEDGIIDYLTRRLINPNRYFIEIGAANGLENNTTWLAVVRNYAGLMVDGDPENVEWCRYLLTPLNYGLQFRQMFVTRENVTELAAQARQLDPDVFSIDIDGNDYHVVDALFRTGFRPAIWVVEFNSAFGPQQRTTIPYQSDFRVTNAPSIDLYCGCSIAAWRGMMDRQGYKFVTVELCGANAFFINPEAFPDGFASQLHGVDFRTNLSHVRAYGVDWQQHFDRIKQMALIEV